MAKVRQNLPQRSWKRRCQQSWASPLYLDKEIVARLLSALILFVSDM